MTDATIRANRRKRGFERTFGLVQSRIREATEARGFSETRLLTHWEDIVGEQTAGMSRPIKVSYAKGGFGATLTLLTNGAFAPMVQAELPKIRERVNAVYGYNAISRIHVTQTAPTGFSEGRVAFSMPKKELAPELSKDVIAEAKIMSDGVQDEGLRHALEQLAGTFLSRQSTQTKEEK